ncbi:hypothetical protein LZ31DRAFT_283041 [Colletotrichum somersetense]|nr:hypothetical protein LZ31DRAFT_283041 [Colletotrichum somersetense]
MLCPSARRLPRYIRHPTPSPYRRLSTTSSSPSPANSKTTTTTTLAHNSLLTYFSLTPSPISRLLVYIPKASQLATTTATTASPRLPYNQPSPPPPPPHQLQQLPSSLDSSSQLSQHRQTGFRKLGLRHHACPAPLATASLPRPPASAPSSCSAQPGLKSLRSTSALRNTPRP